MQDRLVKELALKGIATIAAANVFPRDVTIPAHNARFAIPAEQPGTAFVAIPGVDLDEILCVQEERRAGCGNCVSFNRLNPPTVIRGPPRAHFVKARVKVRQYPDGTHSVFHGPRCLGRYDNTGVLQQASSSRRPPGSKKSRLNPLGGRPLELRTRQTPCPQSHRRTKTEEADI